MRIISCRIHFMFSSAPHFLLKLTKKVRLCHVKAFFANVTYSLRWRQKDRVVVLRLVFNKYSIYSVDLRCYLSSEFNFVYLLLQIHLRLRLSKIGTRERVSLKLRSYVLYMPTQLRRYTSKSSYIIVFQNIFICICIFTLHIIFIFILRCIGLKDRKSCMKQTERYSRKRLDEIHCTSEMYNPVILEIIHAEQIMIWERQERIHLFRVSSIKH